jgi:hypothetical protein
MANPVPEEVAGGPGPQAGPAPAELRWPLSGCRAGSLTDLFSARALAELARAAAGAAGGAVALDLCGHVLQAAPGARPGVLQLGGDKGVPPEELRSLALHNGTLALRPGMGVVFSSLQPFAVVLEHVKLTRPAHRGSSAGARTMEEGGCCMVAFAGAGLDGLMRQCRVELSPAGPAGDSAHQVSMGVAAGEGARVVLEDVDVVGRQGACSSTTAACASFKGARLELRRCASGVWGCVPRLDVGSCV